jgi:hypothetical protein
MKYATYQDYLKSDKWEKVKQEYRGQPLYDESCFLCYAKDHLNLHHWRYPKDWNKDSFTNIILVCHACHYSIHNTKLSHDSHHYNDGELYKYLSHLIKDLNVMELAYVECLAGGF